MAIYARDAGVWKNVSGGEPCPPPPEPFNANFTNAATGTYTDGGVNYKYITYTGTGSITIDQAGFADVLVVGGGGGGAAYSSGWSTGGGGAVRWGQFTLPIGAITVTVGSGGAAATTGNYSGLGGVLLSGGGGGGSWKNGGFLTAGWSAAGGGGSGGGVAAGSADHPTAYAYGGGAGGKLYGSYDYSGIVVDYDNTSIERGMAGFTTGAGAVNTGNGGGTQNIGGGSGIVIVRVVV